jgi:hypothetical protein
MIRLSGIGKALVLTGCVGALGACTAIDVWLDKAVRINGDVYYYNDSGEIEVSEEKLKEMENQGNIVRIKHVAPSGALIVDPEEMTILMQDRAVFYSELDRTDSDGSVSALIKKGSLRKNLERIFEEHGLPVAAWNLPLDYYVSKPFAVVGADLQAIILESLNGYPVYVSFDQKGVPIAFESR